MVLLSLTDTEETASPKVKELVALMSTHFNWLEDLFSLEKTDGSFTFKGSSIVYVKELLDHIETKIVTLYEAQDNERSLSQYFVKSA